MMFETTIIRGNRQIANFDLYPNEELGLFFRAHERGSGGDDWFCIPDLTQEDIETINSLCETDEEKELLGDIKEGDMIDILLHFYVYVKND